MCTIKQQIKKRPWLLGYMSRAELEHLSIVLNPDLETKLKRVKFLNFVTIGCGVLDDYVKVLALNAKGETLVRVGEITHPPKPVRWYRRHPKPYTAFLEKETFSEALKRVPNKNIVQYFLDIDSKILYIL